MIQKLVYGRGNERESERMQEALATLVDTHKLALPNAKLGAEEFFKKKLPYMQFFALLWERQTFSCILFNFTFSRVQPLSCEYNFSPSSFR